MGCFRAVQSQNFPLPKSLAAPERNHTGKNATRWNDDDDDQVFQPKKQQQLQLATDSCDKMVL